MDLKVQNEWKSEYFIFDGNIVKYDAPGNISYGISGKILGFDEKLPLFAAGIAQIQDGTSNEDWRNSFLYRDDAMDQLYIQLGFAYYDKKVNGN